MVKSFPKELKCCEVKCPAIVHRLNFFFSMCTLRHMDTLANNLEAVTPGGLLLCVFYCKLKCQRGTTSRVLHKA